MSRTLRTSDLPIPRGICRRRSCRPQAFVCGAALVRQIKLSEIISRSSRSCDVAQRRTRRRTPRGQLVQRKTAHAAHRQLFIRRHLPALKLIKRKYQQQSKLLPYSANGNKRDDEKQAKLVIYQKRSGQSRGRRASQDHAIGNFKPEYFVVRRSTSL